MLYHQQNAPMRLEKFIESLGILHPVRGSANVNPKEERARAGGHPVRCDHSLNRRSTAAALFVCLCGLHGKPQNTMFLLVMLLGGGIF